MKNKDGMPLFASLLVIYMAAAAALFYLEAIAYNGVYPSDVMMYLDWARGLPTLYIFPYPVFFWVIKFFYLFMPIEPAETVALTLFCGAFATVMWLYIRKSLDGAGLGRLSCGNTAALAAFALLYVGAIPVTDQGFHYVGMFPPNEWHNATYMAARVFFLLAFITSAVGLRKLRYDNEVKLRDWLQTAAFALLAVLTKPSFPLALLPTVALVLLVILLIGRFKNFGNVFKFGLAYIPAGIAMLIQFYLNYLSPASTGRIYSYFGVVWYHFIDSVTLGVLGGMLFPITVLVFNLKKFKVLSAFTFAWLVWLTAFLQAAFLFESGERLTHANLFGAYIGASMMCFIVSIIHLIRETADKTRPRRKYIFVSWTALAVQFAWGLWYFIFLLQGNKYL